MTSPLFHIILVVVLLSIHLDSPSCNGALYILSFDDAPRISEYLSGFDRTSRLVNSLKVAGVEEAVFYCNPRRRVAQKEVEKRLLSYSKAGHIIANHTTNHSSLRDVSAAYFINTIKEADTLLNKYPTYKRWFRYPFLREGREDPEKHMTVKKYLKDAGYRFGYVTVEIYDWHINQVIQKALQNGDRVDFERLKDLYLRVIQESMQFYDALARKTIHRSPVQVVLLHENDLNALYIVDIVNSLKNKGFYVVKAAETFSDPIANDRWDWYPDSMRRLSLIAEKSGYVGTTIPKWANTKVLDKIIEEDGIIQTRDSRSVIVK